MGIIDYFINRLGEEDIPLLWKDIDALELTELLKDGVLKKTEPIDYPLTTGLLMCFLDSTGRMIVLDIGDDSAISGEDDGFYIRVAEPYSFRFLKHKNEWCTLF